MSEFNQGIKAVLDQSWKATKGLSKFSRLNLSEANLDRLEGVDIS